MRDRSVAGWLALRAGLVAPDKSVGECESGPASGIAKLPPDYARVANYLAAHAKPDERILVGLDRHDRIFENPMSLYFAAGRLPGTHWRQYDPGVQTRADIQAAIIADLKRNRVRWIVRDANFDENQVRTWCPACVLSSGVTLLDRYLDENYRPVAASGKVSIWLENGETPGPAKPSDPCEAESIEP
jgi:hypothetical protein